MLILGVDTSSAQASVALAEDDESLCSVRRAGGPSRSSDLLSMIAGLLKEASLELSDIGMFAVAQGPGSFTGLRIGLGSVLGLADSLGRPAAGFSTLDAIAKAHGGFETRNLCVAQKSLPGRVYAAVYTNGPDGISKSAGDMETEPETLTKMINGSVCFTGDGYAPYAGIFVELAQGPVEAAETCERTIAEGLALLAFEKIRNGEELALPVPNYISRSQAEINWEKRNNR